MKKNCILLLSFCIFIAEFFSACSQNANSDLSTSSETIMGTTLNTSVTTIKSAEETTSDITTETNIAFGEWTITNECLGNVYNYRYSNNVFNDFAIYKDEKENINIYDVTADISYKINYDFNNYKIYSFDKDYLYAFATKYIEKEYSSLTSLNFIKYDYKQFNVKTHTIDLGNFCGDFDNFTFYKGSTYFLITNFDGNGTDGLIKINEGLSKTFIPIGDLEISNSSIFIDNNKLFIKPNNDGILELTDNDSLIKVNNSNFYLNKYNLTDSYIIDNNNVYLENNSTQEKIEIFTSDSDINYIFGYKIDNNTHRILVIAMDKIYILNIFIAFHDLK